ncbi:MAG: hypothetical protein IJP34_02110 [Clostridia bacterium]|nr:hypothetical protein [Clostridia bacterium]MBQ9919668.1 hypothetical protein [Clostridia bacterium]
MKIKALKGFVCLLTIVLMLCGSFAAAAAPAYSSNTKDYATKIVVTRDDEPYSVKEKAVNITERDYIGTHTYKLNTELAPNANFYISGKIKFTRTNAINAAPIFGLRNGVVAAFNGTQIKIGSNGDAFDDAAVVDFDFKVGKEYNVVIKSTMTRVSMWIDGKRVINNYALPYTSCGKTPLVTLKFTKSAGYFKNVHIWSYDEVEEQGTTSFSDDVTPVDTSKSEALTEEKVLQVNSPQGENNIWIPIVCGCVAAVVVTLVIVYIVLKQRRALK